jgi:hypothetical protein
LDGTTSVSGNAIFVSGSTEKEAKYQLQALGCVGPYILRVGSTTASKKTVDAAITVVITRPAIPAKNNARPFPSVADVARRAPFQNDRCSVNFAQHVLRVKKALS